MSGPHVGPPSSRSVTRIGPAATAVVVGADEADDDAVDDVDVVVESDDAPPSLVLVVGASVAGGDCVR
jgi:hypothetical protein